MPLLFCSAALHSSCATSCRLCLPWWWASCALVLVSGRGSVPPRTPWVCRMRMKSGLPSLQLPLRRPRLRLAFRLPTFRLLILPLRCFPKPLARRWVPFCTTEHSSCLPASPLFSVSPTVSSMQALRLCRRSCIASLALALSSARFSPRDLRSWRRLPSSSMRGSSCSVFRCRLWPWRTCFSPMRCSGIWDGACTRWATSSSS